MTLNLPITAAISQAANIVTSTAIRILVNLTARSRNSELWFVNNPELEQAVLSYLAKYAERLGVKLYAFAIEGDHEQVAAKLANMTHADSREILIL